MDRLTRTGATDERALLRTALDDRPTPDAKARVLAAVAGGVAVGGVIAAPSTAAAAPGALAAGSGGTGATVGGAAAGAGTGTVTTVGALGVAKWVGVGLVAGTISTGVTLATTTREVEPSAPPVEAATLPGRAPLRPQPEVPVAEAVPAPAEPEAPEPAPVASHRVADEIDLLDRARTTAPSNPRQAQRLIREYHHRFPHGKLGPEAVVLDIQIALAASQRERAAAQARAFLARHADSPHAPRVRGFLARATASRAASPEAGVAPSRPASEPGLDAAVAMPSKTPPAAPPSSSATPSRNPSVARFED